MKTVGRDEFKAAIKAAGIEPGLKWWHDWDKTDWNNKKGWAGKNGNPQGLLLHHNGGAATESTEAKDNKDCSKDENGAKYVNRHPDFNSPASQFFLRRCGQLDINAYTQCYHAGKGDFSGTEWNGHNIPRDSANSYLMGIEIASKGNRNDFTEAQWNTLSKLAVCLKDLYGWKDTGTYYFPRHKDWAGSRKNDIQASNKFVQGKFEEYGNDVWWDGQVPDYLHMIDLQADPDTPYAGSWRLTMRLHDLGFGAQKTKPVNGEQSWPTKNYTLWCEANGVDPEAVYSGEVHSTIFDTRPICECCGQELPE